MAAGRTRPPNDPSIMASVESALSTVARPGLISRLWHWRYELGLAAGVLLAAIAIGYTLGLGWLTVTAVATTAILAACWASDVRVVVNDRRSHIVVLEVIRRLPAGRHGEGGPAPAWPYRDPNDTEPEEPALYYGLGHHRPFG